MLFRIRRTPDSGPGPVDGAVETATGVDTVASVPDPDPIPFRQKGQSTGQDARAERLVLGVRSELSELREFVASLRERSGEAFALDIEAVIADPALALTIPPQLFLDQLLLQRDRIQSLEAAVSDATSQLETARSERHELALLLAVAEARRDALGDVIAAMHANLEDLRAMRTLLLPGPASSSRQIQGSERDA